jgi:uncharacterized membrane protein
MALYLAAASTIAILVSIAVSQILLGAAVVALIVSRTKPRLGVRRTPCSRDRRHDLPQG